MKKVYLGLGSNMGDRKEFLKRSIVLLSEECGEIVCESSVYETAPVGFAGDNNFLNKVILIETEHGPRELMKRLLSIERELGRVRDGSGYSSRTIDIDILLYGDEVIDEKNIKVPHPRMHERKFVLQPLHEIAPGLIHPVLNKSIKELLKFCPYKNFLCHKNPRP
jgi:2-amino-4-hydroxy-6-hydroxymethyldihydropteridine diphosphokinase